MIELIGAFFISILGTFLHFTYDLSNHNKYVSLFSAVNESVWEHLKLLVFPSFLWTLIEIPFLYKNHNFLFAKCVSLIIMTLIIIIFSTIIKKVFERGKGNVVRKMFYEDNNKIELYSYYFLNLLFLDQ